MKLAGTLALLILLSALAPQRITMSEDASGCLSCHAGIEPMHSSAVVKLTCTDCHGGDGTSKDKNVVHVQPRNREIWKSSASPPRTYTALLRESPEFVRFINPGDLRVAAEVCGRC